MPQDTLSFTLHTTTGSGAPPPPPDDGPMSHGQARIPITLRMTLPPDLLAGDGSGPPARSAGPHPAIPGQPDGPSPDAERHALGSLFAGSSGFATTTGARPPPMSGLRPQDLSAALRATARTTPSRPGQPDHTDPGFAAFQAGPARGGRAAGPVAGLPPLPGTTRRPPAPFSTFSG